MHGVVEFDVRVPVDDEGLRANVASTLARDLPELSSLPQHGASGLTIIANGPSALQAPLYGPTLAVNAALGLFTEVGLMPTYWAGCDPQEALADFLVNAPEKTIYLVASKCHPKVFDALKGRRVFVWHVDDYATWELVKDRAPVMSGVSITICAFELMERLGFSSFTTWGWDGCYLDGKDHAVPQPTSPVDIENEVGGKVFATTRTWALEAQDAWHKLAGHDIDIRGGGMIGEIFEFQRAA